MVLKHVWDQRASREALESFRKGVVAGSPVKQKVQSQRNQLRISLTRDDCTSNLFPTGPGFLNKMWDINNFKCTYLGQL